MYVYQLPMMNIIVYYEHVAIKNKSSETLRNFIEHLKTPVQVLAQAAITIYHRLNGLKKAEINLLTILENRVQIQVQALVSTSWSKKPTFFDLYVVEELKCFFLKDTLIPFYLGLFSMIYLILTVNQRFYYQNQSSWKLELQHMDFVSGGTQFCRQLCGYETDTNNTQKYFLNYNILTQIRLYLGALKCLILKDTSPLKINVFYIL